MPSIFILCGGQGTRIRSLGFGVPKPLIKFPYQNKKSILEQILIRLNLAGCKKATLVVSQSNITYFQACKDHIESSTGVVIDFILDPSSISGTAAWLLTLDKSKYDDIIILNGDTYIDGNLFSFFNDKSPASIGAFSSSRDDAGNISVNNFNRVIHFSEKPANQISNQPSLKYSGILRISSPTLSSVIQHLLSLDSSSLSIEYDVLPFLASTSKLFVFRSPIEAYDIGTVDRFQSLSSRFQNGFQNKLAFWDRDSTLNRDNGYTYQLEDLSILSDKLPLLASLSEHGYSHLVITNQSGIGRGYYTESQMIAFNTALQNKFLDHDIYLSDFFFCPHAPDQHGRFTCSCRKPQPHMYLKAMSKYFGDVRSSLIVGDKISDILPAEKIGCTGLLHPTPSMLRFNGAFVLS